MKSIVYAAALAALAAAPANAVITGGAVTGGNSGGAFVQLFPAPGFQVGNNNQSSNNLFAFNELQSVTLGSNLAIDVGSSPITAGTRVNSHVVVFDPVQSRTMLGNVSFNRNVIGIITSRNRLIASNFLGLPFVTYNTPSAVGLEPGTDTAWFVGNTVFVDFQASNPGDEIRVLTAVPEPASWAMLVAGFGLVGSALRRRSVRPVSA